MAKVLNSGTRLKPQDWFCPLDRLEELSTLRKMVFRSMSVERDIMWDCVGKHIVIIHPN